MISRSKDKYLHNRFIVSVIFQVSNFGWVVFRIVISDSIQSLGFGPLVETKQLSEKATLRSGKLR